MAVVPTKAIEKVQWFESHLSPWETNATVIGTTVADVTALEAKVQLAREKFNAQQAAKQTAEAATEAFHAAVKAMNLAGVGILRQIRIKGETTGDPNVYELAEIPGPAPYVPKAPPGKPRELTASLDESGLLNLKWKCANPRGTSGTIYQVWRREGGSGPFTYLGGVGGRKFVDATIPAGATQITYQIQAVRSSAMGPWAQFNVNFGTGAGGGFIASVVEAPAPKLAA